MATAATTARVRALALDPPASVRVQNLQARLQHAAHDAWNRAHKAQPLLATAEVAFAAPFAQAAARDALGADTVHYGTLSKAVLGSIAAFEKEGGGGGEAQGQGQGQGQGWEGVEVGGARERSLGEVLDRVWQDLTGLGIGFRLDTTAVATNTTTTTTADSGLEAAGAGKGLLAVGSAVRLLSVTLALPKASLLGDGVALTTNAVFKSSGEVEALATALEIRRLKVPTLIGLNANERLSKQFVIVTVTIEGFRRGVDVYTEIEGVVVKALEQSSFETLEALGVHLADRVLSLSLEGENWQVGIRMEKPTAVALADCPIIEVRATRESLQQETDAGQAQA